VIDREQEQIDARFEHRVTCALELFKVVFAIPLMVFGWWFGCKFIFKVAAILWTFTVS
jgi:hypothetical protein